jgi:RNA polymerase sigma factor (TIGR02999 family)
MTNVTPFLSAIEQGDPHAAAQLPPLVYDEQHKLAAQKLAQERPAQTLRATALVHEAYLRLVEPEEAQHWNSRGHFFAAVGEVMRRILIDRVGEKPGRKHGGKRRRRHFRQAEAIITPAPEDVVALDEQAFSTDWVTNAARAPIKTVW